MGLHLSIDCPHCGEHFSLEIREVSLNGRRPCPQCRGEIQFTGGFLIKVLRRMESQKGIRSGENSGRSII